MKKTLSSNSETQTKEWEDMQLTTLSFLTLEEIFKYDEITNSAEEDIPVSENLRIYASQHCHHTSRDTSTCIAIGG